MIVMSTLNARTWTAATNVPATKVTLVTERLARASVSVKEFSLIMHDTSLLFACNFIIIKIVIVRIICNKKLLAFIVQCSD